MQIPIGKPHRNFLHLAVITAAAFAAIWVSQSALAPRAFAQGAPSDCLPSDTGAAGMEAYAVILDQNSDRAGAAANAVAISAKLGANVRVFQHGGTYIVVMCGDWMDRATASTKATEAESALSGIPSQVSLFQRR
jgi:hypothetical protein